MPDDILIEFIEDAREHLAAAGRHLIAIEKSPQQPEEINGLLRRLHSIKGNAGFLDLKHLYSLLHTTENIMQTAREQNCAVCPQELIDALFQVLDTVDVMLRKLDAGNSDEVSGLNGLMTLLTRIDREMSSANPVEGRNRAESHAEISQPVHEPESMDDSNWFEMNNDDVRKPESGRDVITVLSAFNQALTDASGLNRDDVINTMAYHSDQLLEAAKATGREPLIQAALLIDGYLSEIVQRESDLTETSLGFLNALTLNLSNWIDYESQMKAPSNPGVIDVDHGDLINSGGALVDKVKSLENLGINRIICNLQSLETLSSDEIGALASALKNAAGPRSIVLVLNSDEQKGLRKVVNVLGLGKIFRVMETVEEARAAFETP